MQLSVCFANPYHPTAIACEVEQKMKPTEERVAGLLLVRLALLLSWEGTRARRTEASRTGSEFSLLGAKFVVLPLLVSC